MDTLTAAYEAGYRHFVVQSDGSAGDVVGGVVREVRPVLGSHANLPEYGPALGTSSRFRASRIFLVSSTVKSS